ncbi:MAG: single-stranded DNA-binding protein [Candidatus Obscuribacter sp.]|nr:single-stranded DNA-binding protein [Candidatus Melainabacteria bacterium]MBK8221688.1 single-stranded DNA-binding protein [Candidatus Obscuribacter sp.]MBK9281693.1 single-stranded DNA-binding protein [Candidatus Obscuribacter sp.]MBL8084348.1 single-stranded DNA-binding protein [Candidatus Obscuribacter sp.]MDX1985811.1 single-stranded DNA-binding protein [Candidatus Obscuribacter sp.]
MSLANVSLVGNLVKAPERIEFSSGRVKTTMVVAVNSFVRSTGKTDKACDFYKVETWGKLAELAARCLSKGNQITVTGRLILDHWTDRQGLNRITPVVEASQLSLPPKGKKSNSSSGSGQDPEGEVDSAAALPEDIFDGTTEVPFG